MDGSLFLFTQEIDASHCRKRHTRLAAPFALTAQRLPVMAFRPASDDCWVAGATMFWASFSPCVTYRKYTNLWISPFLSSISLLHLYLVFMSLVHLCFYLYSHSTLFSMWGYADVCSHQSDVIQVEI